MTCKDCIFNEICERQEDLVQLDDLTWDEYGESNEVERYCSTFRNKADFVEVVRCGKCEHWIYWADEKRCSCDLHHIRTNRDDFCSYGERRKDYDL